MATRVPVPEDFESDVIVCRGTADLPRNADVELADREHARNLRVYEDEEGRYVGTDADTAETIAEFLGVTLDDAGESAEGDDGLNQQDGDAGPESLVKDDEPETCETVKSDGEVCGRELPCPYHSDEGDGEQEGDD